MTTHSVPQIGDRVPVLSLSRKQARQGGITTLVLAILALALAGGLFALRSDGARIASGCLFTAGTGLLVAACIFLAKSTPFRKPPLRDKGSTLPFIEIIIPYDSREGDYGLFGQNYGRLVEKIKREKHRYSDGEITRMNELFGEINTEVKEPTRETIGFGGLRPETVKNTDYTTGTEVINILQMILSALRQLKGKLL